RGGGGGNPLSRSYESNGPDVKIRGNAAHIAEKYTQLSRDAASVGDNVMAENYLQHAEHYLRIILAAQAQYQPRQDNSVDTTPDDDDENGNETENTSNASGDSNDQNAETSDGGDSGSDEQREPRPRRQRRPRRERTEETAEASSEGEKPAEAETAKSQDAAPVAEEAPKKPRRPRRKKTDDDANEPAPELPAFLTAGREAAAE
ncbi:MAG: DUF4167 domain-containing protein, partial [Amphiplicatus sp.]